MFQAAIQQVKENYHNIKEFTKRKGARLVSDDAFDWLNEKHQEMALEITVVNEPIFHKK